MMATKEKVIMISDMREINTKPWVPFNYCELLLYRTVRCWGQHKSRCPSIVSRTSNEPDDARICSIVSENLKFVEISLFVETQRCICGVRIALLPPRS
ncbi:hypothetical protein CDAR_203321 [Caerostris darwini]|uniref:Uncharacterized protein n=1 Tax=Caerostris darwini TaxID=1538125 RepID=A0AAV4Q715_9ARAC|nr:hypothetical protein CDAR_203041 [Caerostris darwini]GIY05307.1 hypothetical protein CDAR_203321 [Caerostris darwini]